MSDFCWLILFPDIFLLECVMSLSLFSGLNGKNTWVTSGLPVNMKIAHADRIPKGQTGCGILFTGEMHWQQRLLSQWTCTVSSPTN